MVERIIIRLPNTVNMPNLYADRYLKRLVQRRRDALSNPDDGELVSEKDALLDMLDDQYHREYKHLKGDGPN